jgi:hypothetical protein
MTDRAERPLLFLDVDGPLLPFGENPQREPRYAAPDSRLAQLSPQTGLRLAALPCTLVWATTWEDEANTEIAPRIGLPTLPVVNWPESSEEHDRQDQWFGLCWKTRTLVNWAAARSPGSTTRSPTPTGTGCPRTTTAKPSSITSSHSEDSPTRTTQPSINGSKQRESHMIHRI